LHGQDHSKPLAVTPMALLDPSALLASDAALREEADAVLAASGLGIILQAAGYVVVGSYAMRTMTWRDLDFERYQEPDWDEHWQVATRLAQSGWCTRLQCVNVYREDWADHGLYLGLRVADPATGAPCPKDDPLVWKLDLWTAREHEFFLEARARWNALMTEVRRQTILALKDAVCHRPEYRQTMLSVHVYEAVLEQGIETLDEFVQWWEATHAV
jgi:hypothetical protein